MADTPPAAKEIKLSKVTASSHLRPWKGFTFDAKNLHDGRVDTSWQPAKSEMLGVGQWIEVDLGGYYAIDRVEIAQGLQLMHPKLGDLFCRNNRMKYGTLIFDDGSTSDVNPRGGDLLVSVSDFYGYSGDDEDLYKRKTRPVARKFLLLISSVLEPVDWSDLAIAEIRVFGEPGTARPPPKGALRCDRTGAYEFKVAALDYCAKLDAVRYENERCDQIRSMVSDCVGITGPGPTLPTGRLAMPPPADVAAGAVTWNMWNSRKLHQFHMVRKGNTPWRTKSHTLVDEAGEAVPPGDEPYAHTYWDSGESNPCWARLKKEAPVEVDYPSCDHDNGDHDDEDGGDGSEGEVEAAPPAPDKVPTR